MTSKKMGGDMDAHWIEAEQVDSFNEELEMELDDERLEKLLFDRSQPSRPYNPAKPSEIAWCGSAMPMYVAGGIIALVGTGLTWLGWPSSQSTTGTIPPLSPGYAAEAFATRPPN